MYKVHQVLNIDTSLTERERHIRAACLIDAEGCIQVTKNQFSVLIAVTSTTLPILQWLYDNYGGSIHDKPQKNPRYKPAWGWYISCSAAENFLRLIFPFLLIKQPQAQTALELRSLQGRRMSKLLDRQAKVSLWQPFYEKMRQLNKRGA